MESATIADCMSTKFPVIHPEMPVVEASSRLIKHEMLGSPVIDEYGILHGWISEKECLKVALEVIYYNQRVSNVSDVMRTDVLSVTLKDDVLTLARQMLEAKPKIYPVIDADKKVLGVITRRHILGMIDNKLAELSKPAQTKK